MIQIVVPVYNEGPNIQRTLKGLESQVKSPIEVLIVYDKPEDNTLPAIREIEKELKFKVTTIQNSYGRGALNALKTGIEKSTTDLVIVMMADLSDPPEVIDLLIEKANAEKADLVAASRYMKGGSQIGGPILKKTLSRAAGLILYYFAGVPTRDSTNNFKLYSRRLIQSVTIESVGGFEFALELTAKAHRLGFKICEVPTTWMDRTAGESRFQLWKWLPLYLRWFKYAFQKN